MPHSSERSPNMEIRQPKVEFDWDKHLKTEWVEHDPLVKELKALIVEGPKGSMNVLKLVGAREVFLKYTGERGGDVSIKGDVIMKKFDDTVDLACLMHEFGHLDQFVHRNFDVNILKLALDIQLVREDNDAKAKAEAAKRVIAMFPDLIPLVQSGAINEKNSIDVMNLPGKIMERGATARALKYFREISDKTGIDFFKKFKVENPDYFNWTEELASADDCQKSMKEGVEDPDKFMETDIVQELNKALKTYRAETLTDTYDPAGTGKRIKPPIIIPKKKTLKDFLRIFFK